ncbi:hypothetical protein BGZ74_004834, partial [Mortierella antarctica]
MFQSALPHPKARQDRFLGFVWDWVILDDQAFTVVETDAFRAMVADLDPRIIVPSRSTIQASISDRYSILRFNLHQIMGVTIQG